MTGAATTMTAPTRSMYAPRRWSSRRVTASVAAVLVLAVAGLGAHGTGAVRTGHLPVTWHSAFRSFLTPRPVPGAFLPSGPTAIVLGSAGSALLLLALVPGSRRRTTIATTDRALRVQLDRSAAAALLRYRTGQVPAAEHVRIHVGPRRAVVRARPRYGTPEELEGDLRAALANDAVCLGLPRPLHLMVEPARRR